MHDTWEILKQLVNPETIIRYGGVTLLFFVIFAETGLMVGFFLPGDSLVFIAGLICRSEPTLINTHIYNLIALLSLAAILGNLTGYYFGRKIGPSLFTKDDNLIFKKKYIQVTRTFYDKNGGKSLILGRFLPIIRTFAPILAGVVNMRFRLFLFYTVMGALLWIGILATLGYLLGEIVWIKENLEWIVIGLIILTAIPVTGAFKKKT